MKYGNLLWLLFGCLLVGMGVVGNRLGVKSYSSIDIRGGGTTDKPIWALTIMGSIIIIGSIIGFVKAKK